MNERTRWLIAQLEAELIKSEERAQYWEVAALTDDLTGLSNRRLLNTLEETLNERRRESKADQATLLFIDLDDFGKINKKYGDDVGDDALRVLAEGVRKSIRKDDIAIRKGGDEFIIILVGANEQDANDVVLKRIENMLNGELTLKAKGDTLTVRGSVGVFPYDTTITPVENLKLADELMREQKQRRKKANAAAQEAVKEDVLLPA